MEILGVVNELNTWVHQAIMSEAGQHKITYGKTVTPQFFACKGKYKMQSDLGISQNPSLVKGRGMV